MIGRKNLHVTAERANFPLGALNVRAGSAANVALIDVPVRAGVSVTAVWMRVTNCDGESDDFAAVQTGTLWVVDVPSSHFATPGEVPGGVEVWASGTGAEGEPHTWSIGVGDLCVLDGDSAAPVPGVAWTAIKLRETVPDNPVYGDAKVDAGALYVWDGTRWVGGGGGGGIVDRTLDPTSPNAVANSAVCGGLDARLSKSGDTMTGELVMSRGNAVVFGDTNGPAVYTRNGTTLEADTRGTTGAVALLSDIPTVPTASSSSPVMDGVASAGTPGTYACGNHRHPTDTTRQASITASGILKGNGAGGVTAAVAGTDYQAPLAAYTSTPSAPTASGSAGSSTAYSRGDHVHPAETLVVTGTLVPTSQDLSTFTVTNLSHTFAEAAAAVASGRGAEVNFTIQLSATAVWTITAPLVLTLFSSGAVESLRFASVFYDYLPVRSGVFPYLARGIWEDDDGFSGRIETLVEQGEAIDMGGGGDSSDPGTLEDSAPIIFHGPDGEAYQIAFGALGAGFGVYRRDSNDNVVMVNPLDGSGYLYPMKTLTTPGTTGYEPGDHEVSRIPISDGTQYIAVVMPAASVINGARDFVVDVDNTQNSDAVACEPQGIGTDFMLLLPAGKTAYDLAYVEAGKYARLYFSETSLKYNGMPFIAAHRLDLEPLLSI